MKGNELNKLAAEQGWTLMKFLGFKDLEGTECCGYKYQYGINKAADYAHLGGNIACCGGGLYFTKVERNKANAWVNTYAYHVSVPDDATVVYYADQNKFKTDKLVIEADASEGFYAAHVYLNPGWLKNIK